MPRIRQCQLKSSYPAGALAILATLQSEKPNRNKKIRQSRISAAYTPNQKKRRRPAKCFLNDIRVKHHGNGKRKTYPEFLEKHRSAMTGMFINGWPSVIMLRFFIL